VAAVCVFCGSSTTLAAEYLELAAGLGTELARRGHTLVSGGGKVGMMGAVTAACRAAGGRTVGVIPELLSGYEIADADSDELTVTASMADRKNLMIAKSDAFITLPGGLGTLDELFEVWTTGSLGLHAKPMVLLDPGGLYAGLRSWLVEAVERGFVRPAAAELLLTSGSVTQAVDAVEGALS
jgi:uncharacterized protein (TIGR00730 family)